MNSRQKIKKDEAKTLSEKKEDIAFTIALKEAEKSKKGSLSKVKEHLYSLIS